jgi:nitrite reductase (NO-forming)
MSRPSWHLSTGLVVVGWLVALVMVALVHPFVPAPRWLIVHLLVLGAVSNAILVWSWHVTSALLRLGAGSGRPAQARRLVAFDVGALAVMGGRRWCVAARRRRRRRAGGSGALARRRPRARAAPRAAVALR